MPFCSSSTGHGDAKQLKDLLNKEDATKMVVVMSSGNKDSPGDPTPAFINPLLLASACFGSSKALTFLFNREDEQMPPMMMPTQQFLDWLTGYTTGSCTEGRLTVQQTSDDVEVGVAQPALPAAAPLLKGVTPEGDTALHAVASHGDSPKFLECAYIIYNRAKDLLFEPNEKGDTPLHCAARAGKCEMVYLFIELAGSAGRLHELLRKENGLKEGVPKETALHDAVRIGNEDIVKLLMTADSELANYPKEGISPLYLAILLKRDVIARTLLVKSEGNLSYSGPNGQNALHVAILRGTVMTQELLKWNNSLTTRGDRYGSTPLHFASSLNRRSDRQLQQDYRNVRNLRYPNIFKQVFEANPAPVYQADNNGLFPIHIAASLGARGIIYVILRKCSRSAGLRDAQGRTFLHVAVEKEKWNIVSFVCRKPFLAWILNMQDNDGNTALHLAVQAGKLGMFCSLFGNQNVQLNFTNNNGQTPLDLSRSKLARGMRYNKNSEDWIFRALTLLDAEYGSLRWDYIEEKYNRNLTLEEKNEDSERVKDATETLGIGAALIATVTFGATFALPGGYRADDHTNGGTPTLAGRYTFDAFMAANTLAFVCSTIALFSLMISGAPMVYLMTRRKNLTLSVFFMSSSVTSLIAAFALGAYMVLSPVAPFTAIAICGISLVAMLYKHIEDMVATTLLATSLFNRMERKICPALLAVVMQISLLMLMEPWPFVVILGWAEIARSHQHHR